MSDSAAKKRRRSEIETPQSEKKKVDFQQSQQSGIATAFSVTKVHRPEINPPVVAIAPGIHLPGGLPFDAYEKDDQPSAKRRKSSGGPAAPTTEMALYSAAHSSVDYIAREDRHGSVDKVLNHFLAIIDPKSGEVEIVQARKMSVRGTARAKQAPPEALEVGAGRSNFAQAKMDLGEAFGTKKAKAALRAVAENKMLADRSRGKLKEDDIALVDTIRDSSQHMATREELQARVDAARPVPRGNFDAEDIQDVYVPAQIIGAEVLNAVPVMDWQDKVKKKQAIEVPARFVAHRIVRVASNTQDDGMQRLKLLRYMLWVIVFYSTTTKGRERGTKSVAKRDVLRQALAPAPEVVVENIRRKFSDGGVMRKEHIDLLMTHLCAFACIIDNFEVDTHDLREDLKLEQKQMNQYFMEIGARIKQAKAGDNVKHIAKLALPLQFPKMRLPTRRK